MVCVSTEPSSLQRSCFKQTGDMLIALQRSKPTAWLMLRLCDLLLVFTFPSTRQNLFITEGMKRSDE
jgi:hypothetical protein